MFALITQEPKARVQSVMSSKIEKGFTAPPSSSLMGRGRRSAWRALHYRLRTLTAHPTELPTG
jgi:hypothetical protein